MHIHQRIFSVPDRTKATCQSSGLKRFFGQERVSGIAFYKKNFDSLWHYEE
jgi:hypothetical protein